MNLPSGTVVVPLLVYRLILISTVFCSVLFCFVVFVLKLNESISRPKELGNIYHNQYHQPIIYEESPFIPPSSHFLWLLGRGSVFCSLLHYVIVTILAEEESHTPYGSHSNSEMQLHEEYFNHRHRYLHLHSHHGYHHSIESGMHSASASCQPHVAHVQSVIFNKF